MFPIFESDLWVFHKTLRGEFNQSPVCGAPSLPASTVLTCCSPAPSYVVYSACLCHDSDLMELRDVPGPVERRAVWRHLAVLTQIIFTFPLCFHFSSLVPHKQFSPKNRFLQCYLQVTVQCTALLISFAFINVIAQPVWFKLELQLAGQSWWCIVSHWHNESADAALTQLSLFFVSLKLNSMWGQILYWNLGSSAAGFHVYE